MIRRGRLRTFDVDWALRQALHEFWLHDYAGTTLLKIKAAMGGICSPSFYAAFGSKDLLFKRVLNLYLQEELLPVLRVLDEGGSQAIRRFLRKTVTRLTQDNKPHGCLMEVCLGNAAGMESDTAHILFDMRSQSSRALLNHLDRMLLAGEISADPLRLLQLISAMISGLSSQAKEGTTYMQLFAVMEDFLNCVLPMAGRAPQLIGVPAQLSDNAKEVFFRADLSGANICRVMEPDPSVL
ncbi:TetR/AcrR family transcriptional regulator [Pseudomonas fluorescens]|uniref:TetR/AcrR family transcriptional regulator n=1 Tax=Pseudomonas fluorescens TaxID=294 RepID=UPI003F9438A3